MSAGKLIEELRCKYINGMFQERTSDKADNVEADDDETSAKNVPTPEYHYSKNEDMDDLMDVLRDDQGESRNEESWNGGNYLSEKSLSPSSVLPNEFGFPNTYGTYELNHLFGDDWLDDGSSPSTLFDNSTTTSGQVRDWTSLLSQFDYPNCFLYLLMPPRRKCI